MATKEEKFSGIVLSKKILWKECSFKIQTSLKNAIYADFLNPLSAISVYLKKYFFLEL